MRLIGNTVSGVYEVREIREGAFCTDFQPPGDQVFVYGREVNDFRVVDYDALAMLNVSATQELSRKLGAKDQRIAELEKHLEDFNARLMKLERAAPMAASDSIKTASAGEGTLPVSKPFPDSTTR